MPELYIECKITSLIKKTEITHKKTFSEKNYDARLMIDRDVAGKRHGNRHGNRAGKKEL